ncbi:hypothetical protein PAXINDRAFT_180755 [Paxillus involutus ATCC 200175]|uniref:ATP-dependent DNA helicase n=1 Tax=Paxillus involutus ATCC 200175 TaxID=664439 RepID=A0A0C9THL0_PAXIN|nr:hypothetical protein PAXINDRAFT_180755 [Paxillus involutus ATCC 200175]
MFGSYDSDHVGSDDMEAILEFSRVQNRGEVGVAGPSKETAQPSYLRKHELSARLSALESEIQGVDEQVQKLKALRQSLLAEKQEVLRQTQAISHAQPATTAAINGKGKAKTSGTIDYAMEFDWAPQLKGTMKKVFGISSFRLCQQGGCNANMDGRDVVCVMPTGGGKSLTYQLPALLTPGCTLVISPLISLITDQILHLREAGVEAAMLTGGTSKALANEIQQRLTAMASARGGGQQGDIKLCYVTPEKIAKSKGFMSLLRKLVEGGKLARIVIDEAHCVSQLGHDFRPDYKKLSALRQFFPHVPILALSATCPPRVLQDILKILHMKPVVDGKAAPREGTVYFSAPLYRKNLHYSVVPKPSSAKEVVSAMSQYILQNHEHDSGIVYCLTKKDAETVATSLQDVSNGRIRTGVYHADVADGQKEGLHRQWRDGSIQVVCATIAFGLGIDKGNVRFVLHHTMSKSLDGYYQESGRAGRDGQDADCLLYYRPQDATRQSSITCTDTDGTAKLHDMLRFAQDMQECRKILFAKYFSASSDLSMTSWTTEESSAMDKCGHCDNCTRAPETIEHKDVTIEAWQILKILEAVDAQGGRQTIAGLSDLARGLGGGSFEASGKRKKSKEKVQLDYDAVAGGKVGLSKDDIETLTVQLLVSRYLGEAFSSTAYTVNVYVIPGELALRLTRLTRAEVVHGNGPRIHCSFKRQTRKGKASAAGAGTKRKTAARDGGDGGDVSVATVAGSSRPRKRLSLHDPVHPESEEEEDRHVPGLAKKKKRLHAEAGKEDEEDEDFTNAIRMVNEAEPSDAESDVEDGGWEYSLRPSKVDKQPYIDSGVISLSSDSD